jgi:solute carrier family 25 phosphate transporter 3
LVTPIDLVKCNKQSNPKLFNSGVFGNIRAVVQARGVGGLFKGWGPTLAGYSVQGLCKFGLYEIFKHEFAHIVGDEAAAKHRVLLYCCASASAEFFADIAYCPLETIKLKVQTQNIGEWMKNESNGFARGLMDGGPALLKQEGLKGMYQIIGALWARQIPYTVIKFVAFEAIIEQIYKATTKHWNRPKTSYNKAEQLGWTFLAGYSAGVICGTVSHPADTMASLLAKNNTMPGSAITKVKTLYSQGYGDMPATGFAGLWKGLGPRVFMIGTLTALQWFIYDTVKVTFGIPTTGSAPPPPEHK